MKYEAACHCGAVAAEVEASATPSFWQALGLWFAAFGDPDVVVAARADDLKADDGLTVEQRRLRAFGVAVDDRGDLVELNFHPAAGREIDKARRQQKREVVPPGVRTFSPNGDDQEETTTFSYCVTAGADGGDGWIGSSRPGSAAAQAQTLP